MKIILFSGKAECGKSTSAKMTKDKLEEMGFKVLKMSYGDYVKETASKIFGWDGVKDEAGRKLLQWWGTDYVRERCPDFWAETIHRLACIIQEYFDYLIIDDTRYENEITIWKDFDVRLIRVERPGHENALTAEQRAHISETSLDEYAFPVKISAVDMSGLAEAVLSVVVPFATAKAEEAEGAKA
jgi:hypothetical protein